MLSPEELRELCKACEDCAILFISDEIYHGISYGTQKEASALEFSSSALVINSFSKYYSMTGWRLGWMVVPPNLIDGLSFIILYHSLLQPQSFIYFAHHSDE